LSISSSNSSRKTSRISSSISSLLAASKPPTGAPAAIEWASAALAPAGAAEALAVAAAGARLGQMERLRSAPAVTAELRLG
jgi:hypothetical protein